MEGREEAFAGLTALEHPAPAYLAWVRHTEVAEDRERQAAGHIEAALEDTARIAEDNKTEALEAHPPAAPGEASAGVEAAAELVVIAELEEAEEAEVSVPQSAVEVNFDQP